MTKAAPHEIDQDPTNDIPPNPRGLKAAVIIMGVLLILGFFVVFTTIIYRVASSGDDSGPEVPRGVFGQIDIKIPTGAEIISTTLDGDRVLVRIGSADGVETLIIFDIRRGHEIGRFRLDPG